MNLNEKHIENKAREILHLRNKIFILNFISKSKHSVRKECDEFGISRTSYYNWKRKFDIGGREELKRKRPVANNHPNKLPQNVIDKILELRKDYQLGSIRITWYLERYHGIKITTAKFGTWLNAVMIQIRTALITMFLLARLMAKAKYQWHLSNLLTFIRLNLFETIELLSLIPEKTTDRPLLFIFT